MNFTTGETVYDTLIIQQTFTDILEQNEFFVQQYNNEINIANNEYPKT